MNQEPTIENLLTDAANWIEAAQADIAKHNAGENPGESDAIQFFSGGQVDRTEYTYADIAKGKIEEAQKCLRKAVEL